MCCGNLILRSLNAIIIKIDAPSGTALMIADAIKEVRKESHYVLGRSEKSQKREENEIGIHAIRAGNLVGEHSVILEVKTKS